jgi:hypothetical protein
MTERLWEVSDIVGLLDVLLDWPQPEHLWIGRNCGGQKVAGGGFDDRFAIGQSEGNC